MSSLEILTSDDNDFRKNLPLITKKAKKHTLLNYEPTYDEITKVYDVVFEFVKKKKLKIYGGFALNLLLMIKNKKMSLYDEDDVPDVDVYSSNPIDDIMELSDILHDKGFKRIQAKQAQHGETYKLFVNFQGYLDITYVPSTIYSKMRYMDVKNINDKYDGLKVIHPWFMMIDYFRIFCDSAGSYWRLEKVFERYKKLQKYYPLPKIAKPLEITIKSKETNDTIDLLYDYLSSKETILFTGLYVYNYYLYVSKYGNKDNRYKYVDIPYFEVYSTEYKNDGIDLLKFIDELPENLKKNIKHEERYPFFQFNGNSVTIYYENKPIMYMFNNFNRCLPFKSVESIKFNNGKANILKNKINIGSFDQNILYLLIKLVSVRVEDKQDLNDTIYKCINGYVNFRKYYFISEKITIYDNSIFESFVIPCIGKQILSDRESRLQMEEKKKKKEKNFMFTYVPDGTKKSINYIFPNSSGNTITNTKRLQLIETSEIEREDESDENNDENNDESDEKK